MNTASPRPFARNDDHVDHPTLVSMALNTLGVQLDPELTTTFENT
jgi:hypothetical protein